MSRVFDTCPADKRDAAEKQIKALIVKTMENNAIWTTDWNNMELPRYAMRFGLPSAQIQVSISLL